MMIVGDSFNAAKVTVFAESHTISSIRLMQTGATGCKSFVNRLWSYLSLFGACADFQRDQKLKL